MYTYFDKMVARKLPQHFLLLFFLNLKSVVLSVYLQAKVSTEQVVFLKEV